MLAFMASRNVAGARSVAARVARAVQAIETFPNAGTYNAETDTYQRFVPKTPVVLTYAIRGEIIWIITAWHAARDPESKPKRTF